MEEEEGWVPPGPAQCAACSAPQCTTTPSTTVLSSIARFMDWCRFPVPLILAMFWDSTHSVIYLKTVDSIELLSLLAMHNCRGVFPLCVPENPTVHQGLSHCGMQICINIFVRREKREEVREEGKKGKQPLQMPHNCTEQMNINVTVKLKWRKNVSRQQTVLELEDSRTCFAYEEVNAQGERGRGCTCNKWLQPPPTTKHSPSKHKCGSRV